MEINSQIFNSGNQTFFSVDCINSKNTEISGTASIEYVAGDNIHLGPEFKTNIISAGYFHAYINPNPYDVVIIDPISTPGHVKKLEKFEIGIKLPDEITNFVNGYIYHYPHITNSINPFDPDQISIEATFESPVTHQTSTIYGFYYKEFQRNQVEEKWDTIHTDYPWRIRFSPNEIGEWKININVSVYPNSNYSQSLSLNGITFICDPSSNKGYLELGSNLNLRFSDSKESFFAIGENIAVASNPPIVSDFDDYYSKELKELASVGGNYVRHWLNSYSGHEIEWGLEMGNYNWGYGTEDFNHKSNENRGQREAWELD